MNAKKIDHVGIVVKDLGQGVQTFADNFGSAPTLEGRRERALGIKNAFVPVESDLEFIQPMTDEGPVATFAKDRGEGMFLPRSQWTTWQPQSSTSVRSATARATRTTASHLFRCARRTE
jgi:hypothetical protein